MSTPVCSLIRSMSSNNANEEQSVPPMGHGFRDRVAHITDLHFWQVPRDPRRWLCKRGIGMINVLLHRRHEHRTERAPEFAGLLLSQGASACIASGDFSSTSLEDEFAQADRFLSLLAGGGLPVLAVPGNHDFYTRGAVRSRRCEQAMAPHMAGELPCMRLLPGGTPVIFPPTAVPDWAARGLISLEAIERTAALVREAPPGPVLVAAHYPIPHTTPGYHSVPTRRLRNAGALRAALGATGRRILCIAGHVHRFSWMPDPEFDMQYLTTAALFLRRPSLGMEGAFSAIDVMDDGFRIRAGRLCDGAWSFETLGGHP